jgi:hypothetical protein
MWQMLVGRDGFVACWRVVYTYERIVGCSHWNVDIGGFGRHGKWAVVLVGLVGQLYANYMDELITTLMANISALVGNGLNNRIVLTDSRRSQEDNQASLTQTT